MDFLFTQLVSFGTSVTILESSKEGLKHVATLGYQELLKETIKQTTNIGSQQLIKETLKQSTKIGGEELIKQSINSAFQMGSQEFFKEAFKQGSYRGIKLGGQKILQQGVKIGGQELAFQLTQQGSKKISETVAKESLKVASQTVVKESPKTGAKLIAESIPFLGLIISLPFAANELRKGNFKYAALELTSGLVSIIPGYGTAASIAVGLSTAGLKIKDSLDQQKEEQKQQIQQQQDGERQKIFQISYLNFNIKITIDQYEKIDSILKNDLKIDSQIKNISVSIEQIRSLYYSQLMTVCEYNGNCDPFCQFIKDLLREHIEDKIKDKFQEFIFCLFEQLAENYINDKKQQVIELIIIKSADLALKLWELKKIIDELIKKLQSEQTCLTLKVTEIVIILQEIIDQIIEAQKKAEEIKEQVEAY